MDLRTLGKEIVTLRKQQHLSQTLLASQLHISRATISALENGTSADIGIKKVMQLLDYLGYELTLKEKSPFPTLEELRDEI